MSATKRSSRSPSSSDSATNRSTSSLNAAPLHRPTSLYDFRLIVLFPGREVWRDLRSLHTSLLVIPLANCQQGGLEGFALQENPFWCWVVPASLAQPSTKSKDFAGPVAPQPPLASKPAVSPIGGSFAVDRPRRLGNACRAIAPWRAALEFMYRLACTACTPRCARGTKLTFGR